MTRPRLVYAEELRAEVIEAQELRAKEVDIGR
jgi:hypothetical protein